MLKSLFNFLGFSKRPNEKTEKELLHGKILQSAEDFLNRPIYKVLTETIIDNIHDDELIQTIFDNLSEKMPKDYTKEIETVLNFSKPRLAIFAIWALEAEVNNGGFNQYYENPWGELATETPDALDLIGAFKYAELVRSANEIYALERDNIRKEMDGTLEGFSKSYKDNPLGKLDMEFYALSDEENLQKLQIDFIRQNKMEFIDA
jgi:hypothetical protein